jgi:hypothetical protein
VTTQTPINSTENPSKSILLSSVFKSEEQATVSSTLHSGPFQNIHPSLLITETDF